MYVLQQASGVRKSSFYYAGSKELPSPLRQLDAQRASSGIKLHKTLNSNLDLSSALGDNLSLLQEDMAEPLSHHKSDNRWARDVGSNAAMFSKARLL